MSEQNYQPPSSRVVVFVQKNSDISDEEFQTYWKGDHRDKVTALIKRHNGIYYSQTYTTHLPPQALAQSSVPSSGNTNMEAWPYSVMITLEFKTPEDGLGFWKDPEYLAMVQEDAKYATQGGKMSIAFASEEVLIS